MQHIGALARPILAATAMRSLMFWEHRIQVGSFHTEAERQVAERNRDAFRAQYQMLTAERV